VFKGVNEGLIADEGADLEYADGGHAMGARRRLIPSTADTSR
jgi:hypothetical protein